MLLSVAYPGWWEVSWFAEGNHEVRGRKVRSRVTLEKPQSRTCQAITARYWVRWSPLNTAWEKIRKWRNGTGRLMDMHVKNGFVRILDEVELENTETDLQWYVPPYRVLNLNKLDKVRRACNAASKFGGVLYKKNWMARSDLLQTLIGIIFTLRERQTALTVDVDAKFLQVKILPTFCKAVSFLWRESNAKSISKY